MENVLANLLLDKLRRFRVGRLKENLPGLVGEGALLVADAGADSISVELPKRVRPKERFLTWAISSVSKELWFR